MNRRLQAEFFEIRRTPPDEKKKRLKETEVEEAEEEVVLSLIPFSAVPKLQFSVKLGGTTVRKITLRNPGKKALMVTLDKIPKEESGFQVDYDNFVLGSQEETILSIGWAPSTPGALRESISVKYGIFKTTIQLIAACRDPAAEKTRKARSYRKPIKSGIRSVARPPNPVVRQVGKKPVIRRIATDKENVAPCAAEEKENIEEVFPSSSKNGLPSDNNGPPPQTVHFMGDSFPKPQESGLSDEAAEREVLQPQLQNWTIEKETSMINIRRETFTDEAAVLQPQLQNWTMEEVINIRRETFIAEPKVKKTDETFTSLPHIETEMVEEDQEYNLRRETYVTVPSAKKVKDISEIRSKVSDLLKDIETDFTLSPEKSKVPLKRLEKFDLSALKEEVKAELASRSVVEPYKDIETDLTLSPEKSEAPPKRLERFDLSTLKEELKAELASGNVETSKDIKTDLTLSPEKKLERFDLSVLKEELETELTPRTSKDIEMDLTLSPEKSKVPPKRLEKFDLSVLKEEVKAELTYPRSVVEQSKKIETDFTLSPEKAKVPLKKLERFDLSALKEELKAELASRSVVEPSKDNKKDFTLSPEKNKAPPKRLEKIDLRALKEELKAELASRSVPEPSKKTETFFKKPNLKSLQGNYFNLSPEYEEASETLSYQESIKSNFELSPSKGEDEKLPEQKINVTPNKHDRKPVVIPDIHIELSSPTEKTRRNRLSPLKELDDDFQKLEEDPVLDLTLSPGNDKSRKQEEDHQGVKDNPISDEQPKSPQLSHEFECLTIEERETTVDVVTGEFQLEYEVHNGVRRLINEIKVGETLNIKETTISKSVNKPLDDVSLLIAKHIKKRDEVDEDNNNDLLSASSKGHPDDTKRYDYKEDTIYETNLDECKESFLHTSVSETSFLPVPKKGYCSTAVKDRSHEENSLSNGTQGEKSSEVCRDLFGNNNNNLTVTQNKEDEHEVFLLTSSPKGSETFAKSPDVSKLSTIPEDMKSGGDLKCNETYDKLPELHKGGGDAAHDSSFISVSSSGIQEQQQQQPETKVRKLKSRKPAVPTFKVRRATPPKKKSTPPFSKKISPVKRFKPSLTLIKPKNDLVRHPNLYSARNIYYDERWIEKEKNGFTKWLNYILLPTDLIVSDYSTKKVDAAKLWTSSSSSCSSKILTRSEVLSIRAYSVRKEMNVLRTAACQLWQSNEVVSVISKLEVEIEMRRLYIRDDKNLNKDVGMKRKFLGILLNYNPLWLRIGLETIFGEVLPINGNTDLVGISRFIIIRLLSNPDILEEFSHPTVPHLYKPGHEDALKKFILKKTLQLIYFLDIAKSKRIIKHNPCLFCKDSDVRMSRDLLLELSRNFLAGEGDVIKHLGYLGYVVNHKQTALDEFDYTITNIAVDLRCGVRLCRVMEYFTDKDFSSKLRVPSVSRLQKVHNVNVALEAMKASPAGLPKEISAKDIVNGHMEKTLALLWHIILGFQLASILSPDKLHKEILHLSKSLEIRSTVSDEAKSGLLFIKKKEDGGLGLPELILKWARLICAHYAVEVENLTVSFSDGRALCLLLHHYYPTFLSREEIIMKTTLTLQQESSMIITMESNKKVIDELLSNEKKNFKLFLEKTSELGGVPMLIRCADMSNTIPDQKVTTVFLAFLAARLLDLSAEMKAARTIQRAWRRRKYAAKIKNNNDCR